MKKLVPILGTKNKVAMTILRHFLVFAGLCLEPGLHLEL